MGFIFSLLFVIILLLILGKIVSKKKPIYMDKVPLTNQNKDSYSMIDTMDEEDDLAFLEMNMDDRESVKEWFESKKNDGYYFSDKVYAMAMHIIEGRKWLSDDEYKAKQARAEKKEENERNEEVKIYNVVKDIINIVLDWELSNEEQKSKIDEILKPYSRKIKFCKGVKKQAYWHAMHIIMNSPKMPDDIAYKARTERQKVMGNFTRRKINEFPLLDIKRFPNEAKIKLTAADIAEYQNFIWVNHERDF
ncbi:MAG: hypothetical protein NTX03_10640 [Bacteroidetes bacterium]|nr:hypothetical protein [Bacteroidota bacterium]